MAISRKGLRTINVEGQEYLWRFRPDIAHVYQEFPFGEIQIDYGYIPSVEDMGDYERLNRTDRFEARWITPSFIRRAILFAKHKNWQQGKMSLKYVDSKFNIIG